MKKLAWLAVLIAAPAAAQDGWPVVREGAICTTSRGASATSDALILRYDPAGQRLSLQTAVESDSSQVGTGSLDLWVIFNKGKREELDIGWGFRPFSTKRDNGRLDLSTSFAGSQNVKQVLADLAASERLGLVRDKKTVADFDLAGIGPAVERLKACARGA